MIKYTRIDLSYEDCSGIATEDEFNEAYLLLYNVQSKIKDCVLIVKTNVLKEVDASFDHEFGIEKRTEIEIVSTHTSILLMEDLDIEFHYELSKRDWSAGYQKNKYPKMDELFITNTK